MVIIIILQKILNPGSVFYISKRLGKNGKVFNLYKFRSMKEDASPIRSSDNKLITVVNDARITKFGKVLRLGFDELPQLINILRGEMCLIGPRPDLPEEINTYTERQKIRLLAIPGITGLTQVLDGRNLSNDDNLELDVKYFLQSTGLTDIKIAILTLPYSLFDKGIGRKYFNSYMKDIDTSYVEEIINE